MLAIETVLVPTDCSESSATAVEYAIAVADRYGASLHLLQVLDERVVDGLETGDVAAEAVAEDYQGFVAEVEAQVAEAAGVDGFTHSSAAGFSARSLRRSPGSVVLDAADEVDADFIVIPRETQSNSAAEAIGKAALYVVEYASQPVLSV
jgi:nucleotide-binding universal stress UspA family protein